jgi:GntR family transcriptional regulator
MMGGAKGVPKYVVISQQIVGQIRQGELRLGALVPSENELIAQYRISNTTARKVLLELEREGWVTRIKGRGTYVRQDRVERTVSRILSFTRNMVEAGRTPSTKLLDARVMRGVRSLIVNSREYHLPGPFYEVRRLRLADGVPMMLETRYVSMQLCPGLDRRNLEGSLYDIYEQDYGLRLVRIDQILSATVLEGRDLTDLAVEAPIPAFRVEGVTFVAKELILEMEDSSYRGDTYRFYVTATQ